MGYKAVLAGVAGAAIAVSTLAAAPAQAHTEVDRTINFRAGQACEFPVSVRIRADLDVDRRPGNRLVVDLDHERVQVTNRRNGDTWRARGDATYRINLNNSNVRGDGEQLLLVRDLNPGPRVGRLAFTDDRTRFDLRDLRRNVLPVGVLRTVDGTVVNVCAQIR